MRRRIALTIALALVALGLGTTPARAAGSPFALPRGADTTVPYLAGRTLHVGSRSYTVPDQSQGGDYRVDYRLIGLDARGRWLVGAAMDLVFQTEPDYYTYGARARILAVGPSGATTVYDERNDYGATPYFRLGGKRTRVVLAYHQTDDDSFADTDVRVLDLGMRTVALLHSRNFDLTVLDAWAGRVVLGGRGTDVHAWVWTPGHGLRRLTTKPTSLAALRTRSLAVRGTKHRWAMTRPARPGKVRWQAWFDPVRVSPNGKRVVGVALAKKNGHRLSAVQVRRLSDGHLVRSFAFSRGVVDATTMTWSGSASVVFQAGAPGRTDSVLVRCGMAGRCTRVSDAVPAGSAGHSGGDPVSVAFEPDPPRS